MSWKVKIRKLMAVMGWTVIGAGMLMLLAAAIRKRNSRTCKGYRIEIISPSGKQFIERQEVLHLIMDSNFEHIEGRPIHEFNLLQMEERLEKDPWVHKSLLFFDNNDLLRVSVTEREPVARIITVGGNSFYIDSSGFQLPLNRRQISLLPVFTGYPYERIRDTGLYRPLLNALKEMSGFIRSDSFWSAQVSQVEILPGGNFKLIPEVGNHVIEFGDGSRIVEKFHKLFIFYKEVLSQVGMDKYASLNVSFEGQVVGTRRSGFVKKADSIQAVKNITQLIQAAQHWQSDTARFEHIKPLENSEPAKEFQTGDLLDSTVRKIKR
jgi:cell division protein FtsQ